MRQPMRILLWALSRGSEVVHGKPHDYFMSANLEKLFGVDAPVVEVNGHSMVMHYL